MTRQSSGACAGEEPRNANPAYPMRKAAAKEVREGFECGLNIKNYNDIQESDVLEFFEIREIARTL